MKSKKVKEAVKNPRQLKMKEKLATGEGKKTYARCKSTVDPLFGIIKAAMGFRQFLPRGREKMHLEWTLVYRLQHEEPVGSETGTRRISSSSPVNSREQCRV